MDTGHWRVCEHKGETYGIHFGQSIDFHLSRRWRRWNGDHSAVEKIGWRPFGFGEDGVATLQWHGTGDVFPSWCKTRWKEKGRRPNVLL